MSDLTFGRMILHDFKSFLGKHIIQLDRSAGLYYIQGKNKRRRRLGSNSVGKTTIWDGVTWILWGTTGSDRRPAGAVVPWSKPGAHTWGALTWTKDGKKHKLKRSRNPNKLTLDGQVVDQSEIPRLLSFSEEMFRRSVVLSQFEELFLDLLPEKQSRLFNEALDLEVWLKASKAADRKRRDTLEECFKLRDQISKDIGRLKEVKIQLGEAKKNKQNYEANLNKDIDRLAKKMGDKGKQALKLLQEEGFNKLDDFEHEISKRREGVARWKLRIEKARRGRNRLIEAIDSTTEALKSYERTEVCPECGQKVSKSHLETKVKHLRINNAKAKAALKSLDHTVKRNTEGSDVAHKNLAEWEQLYEKARALSDEYDSMKAELKRLQGSDNPYHSTFLDLTERRAVLRKNLDEKDQDYAELEKQVEIYSYWQDAFKEIRISLIDQVLAELELAVTTNAEALGLEGYRIQFQTERENRAGNITVVFNVLLHTPDHDGPVKWQNYSGGERQRLQLAMAFGLSEVILDRVGINPNIEVLDEPTHHTSTEGVDDLLERLHERAAELGRAIYFCDHHSFDRGIFDGTLLVTKGRGGSKLTSF